MTKKQATVEQEEEKRGRGRPALENAKISKSLRLDPEVLAYFEENTESTVGAAINQVLLNYIKRKQRA